MGEEMGHVKEQRGGMIVMAGTKHFNNGDGLCYTDERDGLQGFRLNRVDQNRLFPQDLKGVIRPKMVLYRNYDHEFEKLMAKPTAERKIRVQMTLSELPDGFLVRAMDEDGCSVAVPVRRAKEEAHQPQEQNIRALLSKLGNTPFVAESIRIQLTKPYFLPASVIAEVRRLVIEKLLLARKITYPREWAKPTKTAPTEYYKGRSLTYLANCYNEESRKQYQELGAVRVDNAYESRAVQGAAVMFCRHCIRYMMGWCPTHQKQRSPFREPYYLVSKDGRRFRLDFDCKNCQMKVYEA